MTVTITDPSTNSYREIEIPIGENIILVDPSLVYVADFEYTDKNGNILVRLRRSGWGKPEAMNAIRVIPIPSKE